MLIALSFCLLLLGLKLFLMPSYHARVFPDETVYFNPKNFFDWNLYSFFAVFLQENVIFLNVFLSCVIPFLVFLRTRNLLLMAFVGFWSPLWAYCYLNMAECLMLFLVCLNPSFCGLARTQGLGFLAKSFRDLSILLLFCCCFYLYSEFNSFEYWGIIRLFWYLCATSPFFVCLLLNGKTFYELFGAFTITLPLIISMPYALVYGRYADCLNLFCVNNFSFELKYKKTALFFSFVLWLLFLGCFNYDVILDSALFPFFLVTHFIRNI